MSDGMTAMLEEDWEDQIANCRADKPTQMQVGGSHYTDMKIQPFEFIHANGIGFAEGCAIKYLCRHRNKNGRQDLEKAKHFIDLLIAAEYPKKV